MSRIKYIKEFSMSGSPSAIITQEKRHCKNGPHPFIVDSKHLGQCKTGPGPDLKIYQYKMPCEADGSQSGRLYFPIPVRQIQCDARHQNGDGHVPGNIDYRQKGIAENPDGCSDDGVGAAQYSGNKGPGQKREENAASGSGLSEPAARNPFKSLKAYDQDEKRGHHGILRIEAVRPDENVPETHKKVQQPYGSGNTEYFEKIPFPASGMEKAFHQAEEKQRRRQAAGQPKPPGNQIRIAEEIIDMVHQHGYKSNPFQACFGDTALSGSRSGPRRNAGGRNYFVIHQKPPCTPAL